LPIYARASVRHAWLVDPIEYTLEAFTLEGDGTPSKAAQGLTASDTPKAAREHSSVPRAGVLSVGDVVTSARSRVLRRKRPILIVRSGFRSASGTSFRATSWVSWRRSRLT
jgi:hypothetical protein